MTARTNSSLRSGRPRLNGASELFPDVPTKRSSSHPDLPPRRGKRGTPKPVLDEVRPVKRQKVEDPAPARVKAILRSRQPKSVDEIERHDRVSPPVIQPPRATESADPSSNNNREKRVKIYGEPTEHSEKIEFVPEKYHIDKRTLRSQDGGARFRSELSQYFPNYDQLMSFEPVEKEPLTADTQIILIDDLNTAETSKSQKLKSPTKPLANGIVPPSAAHRPPSDLLTNLHNAHRIILPPISKGHRHRTKDALSADIFFKAHRRAERQEKQLRNIEKERAQHEKVDLERLLEQLRGPDWLRVFGVSGVTDSEKKKYEPKRRLFIKLVFGLIEKFRVWKEEDKRRKLEREAALLADEQEQQTHGETSAEEEEEEVDDEEEEEEEDGDPPHLPNGNLLSDDGLVDSPVPDVNDIDAWAARQLHQEAHSANKKPKAPVFLPASPPQRPFHSFFEKSYLREAAMSKQRRGRNVHAFGHPIPEMEQRDFELPAEYLTPEAIRASMRKRRRLKRESKDIGAGV